MDNLSAATKHAGRAAEPLPVVVRPMATSEVGEAAGLHAAQLPHGFFPRLGTLFLSEYYRAFAASPYAVVVVADGGSGVAGVAVGVVDGRHHQWVLANRGLRLAAVGALCVALRPWLLKPLVAGRLGRYATAVNRVRRRRRADAGVSNGPPAPAVLAHIAVDDAARGQGIGTRLVTEFLRAARDHGAGTARTTTLDGPEGALDFYRTTGWDVQTRATDWDGKPIIVLTRPTL